MRYTTQMDTHLVAEEVAHEAQVGRAGHHDVQHEHPGVLAALQGLVHAVARVRADVLVRLGRLEQVNAYSHKKTKTKVSKCMIVCVEVCRLKLKLPVVTIDIYPNVPWTLTGYGTCDMQHIQNQNQID